MAGESSGALDTICCLSGPFIIGTIIWFLYKKAQKRNELMNSIWMNSANQLGLTMDLAKKYSRNMYGAINGLACRVYTHTVTHGSSSNRRTVEYTNFEVSFPQSLNMGLILKREVAMLGKLAKMMGNQDIQTGDPAFDACFTIKGMNEQQVRTFLTNERRQSIMHLRQSIEDLQISDLGVSWMIGSTTFDPNTIPFYLNQFVQLAHAIYPHKTTTQFSQ